MEGSALMSMSNLPQNSHAGLHWQSYSDVTEAGFRPDALEAVRACASAQATDALIVVRHGRIVCAIGDPGRKFLCHSIRKSFLAALFGIEIENGRIELSATLDQLGIDDREGLSDIEKQATVFDLLMSRSGVYHPAAYETAAMRLTREKRHSHAPGTFWCYNNWDFNTLGTVYAKTTGETVHEAFAHRIAGPIGMEDFSLEGPTPDGWHVRSDVSDHPAYPFRMSSRDLARFGQLFLQNGRWAARQVLPADWVRDCTLPYSHAGPRGAYGYMWWVERDRVFLPGVVMPQGSYAAWGAGGHFCVVIPHFDMVVVHRVDTEIAGREVSNFGFGRLMRCILAALDT
jgi:CubicO group peptidase (beta-lactamase class C family)